MSKRKSINVSDNRNKRVRPAAEEDVDDESDLDGDREDEQVCTVAPMQ